MDLKLNDADSLPRFPSVPGMNGWELSNLNGWNQQIRTKELTNFQYEIMRREYTEMMEGVRARGIKVIEPRMNQNMQILGPTFTRDTVITPEMTEWLQKNAIALREKAEKEKERERKMMLEWEQYYRDLKESQMSTWELIVKRTHDAGLNVGSLVKESVKGVGEGSGINSYDISSLTTTLKYGAIGVGGVIALASVASIASSIAK
jgi:hypothetical protein